jgi:transcriptional antiterminator NusG
MIPETPQAAREDQPQADVPETPAAAPEAPAAVATAEPAAAPAIPEKKWYVVKVTSGRENTIKEAIEKRVKIEGLEDYFGQIVVPVERETTVVKGKRVTRTKKLYPGYLMVEVAFNDKILYLFRETPGVGDFVGAGPRSAPTPMKEHEVQRMLGQRPEAVREKPAATKIRFSRGDRVKIREGMFANMEGEVSEILEAKGLVRVMLKIFGREVPVELEDWQIDPAS